MKYYLATALSNAERAVELQEMLEAEGLEASFDWARPYLEKLREGAEEGPEETLDNLLAELEGVRNCDVFILVTPYKRGAATELGAALALGKPSILLLDDSNMDAHDFAELTGLQTAEAAVAIGHAKRYAEVSA